MLNESMKENLSLTCFNGRATCVLKGSRHARSTHRNYKYRNISESVEGHCSVRLNWTLFLGFKVDKYLTLKAKAAKFQRNTIRKNRPVNDTVKADAWRTLISHHSQNAIIRSVLLPRGVLATQHVSYRVFYARIIVCESAIKAHLGNYLDSVFELISRQIVRYLSTRKMTIAHFPIAHGNSLVHERTFALHTKKMKAYCPLCDLDQIDTLIP